MGIWRAFGPRPASVTRTDLYYGGPSYIAGYCPTGEDSLYAYIVEDAQDRSALSPEEQLATMKQLSQAYHGPWDEIRETLTDPSRVNYTWFETHVLDAPWNRGRVVLIGDAAHTCPPTIAQGGAMALEDAVVLAELLTERDALDQELWDAFTARRFERAKTVVDASNQLAQWQLDHVQGDIPGLMRSHRHAHQPARLKPRPEDTTMTQRLITHLRHVDLAVPDFAKQLDFYTNTWGLTGRAQRLRPGLPGRRGLARSSTSSGCARPTDKRIDLISFGAATAGRRRHPGRRSSPPTASSWSASPAPCRPPAAATASGSSTTRAAPSRSAPTSPSAQHRKIEEGESIPVRLSHVVINSADPEGTRAFYEKHLALRPVGHPDAPAHGRDDVVHADQRLAPQPGDRPRPAPLAAPRLASRCAASTSTCAAPAGCCAPASRRSGAPAGTWPATTPSATSSTRTATPSSTRPSSSWSTRTPGTRTCTTSPTPRSATSGARRTR